MFCMCKGHKIIHFTNLTELNCELNSHVSVCACMYVWGRSWLPPCGDPGNASILRPKSTATLSNV